MASLIAAARCRPRHPRDRRRDCGSSSPFTAGAGSRENRGNRRPADAGRRPRRQSRPGHADVRDRQVEGERSRHRHRAADPGGRGGGGAARTADRGGGWSDRRRRDRRATCSAQGRNIAVVLSGANIDPRCSSEILSSCSSARQRSSHPASAAEARRHPRPAHAARFRVVIRNQRATARGRPTASRRDARPPCLSIRGERGSALVPRPDILRHRRAKQRGRAPAAPAGFGSRGRRRRARMTFSDGVPRRWRLERDDAPVTISCSITPSEKGRSAGRSARRAPAPATDNRRPAPLGGERVRGDRGQRSRAPALRPGHHPEVRGSSCCPSA